MNERMFIAVMKTPGQGNQAGLHKTRKQFTRIGKGSRST